MSSVDWTEQGNSLSAGIVARGATGGITPPNGGGSAVYAMNCLDGTVIGGVALRVALSDYNPTAKGASVRGTVKKLSSASNTGFTPFLFCMCGGTDIDDNAYILGLENRHPYRIVLVKGSLLAGVPEAVDGAYLRRSSDEYQITEDKHHHLRLDAIAQPSGDVYLQVYENDLDVNPVTAPVWTAIPGMAQFVDDVAGINSGSVPYTAGYLGFGSIFQEAVSTRVAFDHFQALRQT